MRLSTRWSQLPLVFVLAACQGGNLALPGEAPAAEPPTVEEAAGDLAPVAEATAETAVETTTEAGADGAADDGLAPTPVVSDGTTDAAFTDASAQAQTVKDLRNVGTAMFSWLTDQVGAAPPDAGSLRAVAAIRARPWISGADGSPGVWRPALALSALAVPIQFDFASGSPVDLSVIPEISRSELEKVLVPTYIQEVPEADGWGNRYAYHLDVVNVLNRQVMAIRSPGRDGAYSGSGLNYVIGAFPPTDYDEDIVWSDGFFVRWPDKTNGM